jgi:hypothetical protein
MQRAPPKLAFVDGEAWVEAQFEPAALDRLLRGQETLDAVVAMRDESLRALLRHGDDDSRCAALLRYAAAIAACVFHGAWLSILCADETAQLLFDLAAALPPRWRQLLSDTAASMPASHPTGIR